MSTETTKEGGGGHLVEERDTKNMELLDLRVIHAFSVTHFPPFRLNQSINGIT